ncbi:TPA: hypothetical protein G9E65_004481 [Salmonella enterica]|nr:hypothetical protein [Salmonella enterica subsp. enterica serovar Miami]HAF1447722.1 hypothetical protein [Salmonella enterica]HAF6188711.1 hypothetical protein [Salmonella enterica]
MENFVGTDCTNRDTSTNQNVHGCFTAVVGKRTARAVLTGMCYSVGGVMRQGSSSLTRLPGNYPNRKFLRKCSRWSLMTGNRR